MIAYLKYFFNPSHLFSLRPAVMQWRAIIILMAVFGLLILMGIISKVMAAKSKDGLKIKAWRRLSYLALTISILGFVYLFFAWQGVVLLAGRFWLLTLLLIALIWLGFIAKYWFLEIPILRREIQQKRNFEKYIP